MSNEASEKARALVQARWLVEKHMRAFDCFITHPDTLKASIADAMYNFGQPPVASTARSYDDLPDATKAHLITLEEFLSHVDGKDCVIDSGDGGQVMDDGTIDSAEAVLAFNEIVLLLRKLRYEQEALDRARRVMNEHERVIVAMDGLLCEAADYLNGHYQSSLGMDIGACITEFRRERQRSEE